MNTVTLRQMLCVAALPLGLLGAQHVQAQADPALASGQNFQQLSGQTLYQAICQGCHMVQGQGAQGAGMYPPLAGNTRLAASGYPVSVVLHGLKGMPSFSQTLNDAQIAAVVEYVRTSFGNQYPAPVTVQQVQALRK